MRHPLGPPPQRGTQPFEYQFADGGSIIAVKMLQFQHLPQFMAEVTFAAVAFDAVGTYLVPGDPFPNYLFRVLLKLNHAQIQFAGRILGAVWHREFVLAKLAGYRAAIMKINA